MTQPTEAVRLFLITPAATDAATFPAVLGEALAAAEVAAVLIADATSAAALVPLVQKAGAAALILDDTRLAGRLKADGVHIGTGISDVRLASESFRQQRIVGAGNIHSRHAAMETGEIGVDYLFFGRPHGDTHDAAHPKALELAAWCSELMEIPAVMMTGRALDSIADAAATGAAFVALHEAVWSYVEGPAAALRRAAAILEERGRRAA